jgi:hypothetical protein
MILSAEFKDHAIFEETTKGFAFDFETGFAEHLGLFGVFYELACGDEGFFWFRHHLGVVPRCGDLKIISGLSFATNLVPRCGEIFSMQTAYYHQPCAAMRRSENKERDFFLLLPTYCRDAAKASHHYLR